MYSPGKKTAVRSLLMAGIISLSACTSQEPNVVEPEINWATIKEVLNCPVSTTPACIERTGKKQSCFCADEDLMRRVMEPTKYF